MENYYFINMEKLICGFEVEICEKEWNKKINNSNGPNR